MKHHAAPTESKKPSVAPPLIDRGEPNRPAPQFGKRYVRVAAFRIVKGTVTRYTVTRQIADEVLAIGCDIWDASLWTPDEGRSYFLADGSPVTLEEQR